jgi:hypothetical protein
MMTNESSTKRLVVTLRDSRGEFIQVTATELLPALYIGFMAGRDLAEYNLKQASDKDPKAKALKRSAMHFGSLANLVKKLRADHLSIEVTYE